MSDYFTLDDMEKVAEIFADEIAYIDRPVPLQQI